MFRIRHYVFSMISILIILIYPGQTAISQCTDFDGLAPAMGLHTSKVIHESFEAGGIYVDMEGTEGDFLSYGTDGAVIVYRGQDPTTLEACRFIDALYLWSFKTEGNICSKPLVERGIVFFGSDDGYYYALDERTGILLWKFDGRREETIIEKVKVQKKKKKKSPFGKLGKIRDAVDKYKEVTKTEYKPNNLRACPALSGDVLAVYVPPKYVKGLNYLTGEVVWESALHEEEIPFYASLLPKELFGPPIFKINALGDNFILLCGAIFAFNAENGERSFLNKINPQKPIIDQSNLKIFIDATIVGDKILTLNRDSTVSLFNGNGTGQIWNTKLDSEPWIMTGIYGDEKDGFVTISAIGDSVKGKIVCIDVETGDIKWQAESPIAERVWLGPERAYLIHDNNQITAFNRVDGKLIWTMNLDNFGVEKLYDVKDALIFAKKNENEITILNTQQRAYNILLATANSYDKQQPSNAIRNILKKGYPEYLAYYRQDIPEFANLITSVAADSLRKRNAITDTMRYYKNWRFISQVSNDSSTDVNIEVELAKIHEQQHDFLCIHPEYDTLTFHLVKKDTSWMMDLPLPFECRVDTQEGIRLFDDTPGISNSAAVPYHCSNHLMFYPGDKWKFKCVSPDGCLGEGYIHVNYQEKKPDGSIKTYIFQRFPCRSGDPGQNEFGTEDCSFERTITITYDTAKFCLELSDLGELGIAEFSLPLQDGAKYTAPGNDGASCILHILKDDDGKEIYDFSIYAPGDIHYDFQISPQKGFISYKHRNFDVFSEWVLEDYRKW